MYQHQWQDWRQRHRGSGGGRGGISWCGGITMAADAKGAVRPHECSHDSNSVLPLL